MCASTTKLLIEGVVSFPLKVISDERGAVLHMLRKDSPAFTTFGEVYFSEIKPGVVKAWKRHHRSTQQFAVPVGCIQLVMYDDRMCSTTSGTLLELSLGRPDAYLLVRIPPLVWYGFKGMGETNSIVANCMDVPYDSSESDVREVRQAPVDYDWSRSEGNCA